MSRDTTSEESGLTLQNPLISSKNRKKTTNESPKYVEQHKQSFLVCLTQKIVFALFVLILFCFVIFLSLPVVLKTSCDFNSMNFHFTIESLPQNNVCIK